jgi:hypothetical protein
MRLGILAAAAIAAASGTAFADGLSAADTAALTAPVAKLAAAINATSTMVPANVFAPHSVVLDDFAPFKWAGDATGSQWYTALAGATPKDQKAFVAMKPSVKIGAAAFARISDDKAHAYVVFPSTFDFTEDGKRTHQTAQWIITEEKVGAQWLISGHAWAIVTEGPAGS